ncbi:MAG: DUF1285 domain-containing protein [Deltaproteobacteria bacterium]|nr:DUF1285 domain-containing protein [Deltaproteobacteria bacterium]
MTHQEHHDETTTHDDIETKNEAVVIPEEMKAIFEDRARNHEIRLDREGRWTYRGAPVTNKKVVDLFNRSIRRTTEGDWVLHVGKDIHPIIIEDTPYFVERMDLEGENPIVFLNDGTAEILVPETIRYKPVGRLYCLVKDGTTPARFTWNAYHGLAEHMDELDGWIVLNLPNTQIRLAPADEETSV